MGGACSRAFEDDHEQELSVRLQRGITGGFAGPDPDEIHTLTKSSNSSSILVNSLTRPTSSQPLSPAFSKRLPIGEHKSAALLLGELRVILGDLPTEKPQGIEDIYGEDTSIHWWSEDFEWWNGGSEGCGSGGRSRVQPTEKQKEKFKRAVEIVHELVDMAV